MCIRDSARVTAISSGFFHTCARRASGKVWCWGDNGHGELGDGTTHERQVPVRVRGVADITSISAGSDADTCARRTDGSAWCWGFNYHGALGDGTTTERHRPVRVVFPVGQDDPFDRPSPPSSEETSRQQAGVP
jgi:alpha-tubulin suppressor-like RCC1 family protein